MAKVKMKIHGEIREVTIKDMVCRDCIHRHRINSTELQVLNCRKYPGGKPYIVLKTNRCEEHRSE